MTPPLGLIEGFFGRPWSWDARRDAVTMLAPHGYRFYLYAPKADRLLRERWQDRYDEADFERIADFARHCRAENVRFGIGLSPFELHLRPDDGWQEALGHKLAELDQFGPDDLAILFDDMRGDVPDLASRQAAIVHFAAERSSASRIICCPSYYSDDPILDVVFGERPPAYLDDLGRMLDREIEIMWTGEEVCSREFSVGHIVRVADQLGRKPFLWDNYPVNDGARMAQHLHLRGFTGRSAAIGSHLSAHGINLALQPVLSRIPALTAVRSSAQQRLCSATHWPRASAATFCSSTIGAWIGSANNGQDCVRAMRLTIIRPRVRLLPGLTVTGRTPTKRPDAIV
jgi:hyaluronoglucosaminidase